MAGAQGLLVNPVQFLIFSGDKFRDTARRSVALLLFVRKWRNCPSCTEFRVAVSLNGEV
jgi:hypothetical protein